VLKLRSVNNIVIAPANTGKLSTNNQAVMKTDHTNKGYFSKLIPGARILIVVVMMFNAPIRELTPAMCDTRIAYDIAHRDC
jgi:hypothetical protein